MAAKMLTLARFPDHFWKEASALATLILNVTPWKREGKFQVDSFLRLTETIFPYNLLRVFGCKAFVYDQQKRQLQPHAKGISGYLLWIREGHDNRDIMDLKSIHPSPA